MPCPSLRNTLGMEYKKIVEGKFISRPNRFIARVLINGKEETVHVKNTGRCKELLVPDARVYLEDCRENSKRKTPFDLVAVMKGKRLINMDSQAPNKASEEFLRESFFRGEKVSIHPEYTYKKSRIDFLCRCKNQKYLVEVKGVTLEKDGRTYFPDAPTERGLKHINELSAAISDGFCCIILFVIQMDDVLSFSPNEKTQPQFKSALIEAEKKGVVPLAYCCKVTPSSMVIDREIPIIL